MGTRCVVVVHDQGFSGRLYRQWDGYPEGALHDVLEAADGARDNDARSLFEAISRSHDEKGDPLFRAEETSMARDPSIAIFGDQGDLEYIYAIDADRKSLTILGSFSGFESGDFIDLSKGGRRTMADLDARAESFQARGMAEGAQACMEVIGKMASSPM